MASQTGGQFIITAPSADVNLGINDGVNPVFPAAISGELNIEVFTSALAPLDQGFQKKILDPNGQFVNNFLTGTALTLFGGDYLIVDTGNGAGPASVTLGTGKQTVIGAAGDTLIGGSGDQILDASSGDNQVVVGGTGNYSVFGGFGTTISGSANADRTTSAQLVAGNGTRIILPNDGTYTVSGAQGSIVTSANGSKADVVITTSGNALVDLSGNIGDEEINAALPGTAGDTIVAGNGNASVYAGQGDSIVGGGVGASTYIDGRAGGVTIVVGSGGSDTIIGSTTAGFGDTIRGGAASVDIQGLGDGDIVNFTDQTGNARINATDPGRNAISLGAGNAIVFGGNNDTVNFGTGNQYVDGRAGAMTIQVGGAGGTNTIIGTIVPGQGDTMTGGDADVFIQALGAGDLVNFSNQTGTAIINSTGGTANLIVLGSGTAAVFGSSGDTINFGSGNQYYDGTEGGALIKVGTAGVNQVIGSETGLGNSIIGGSGSLNYNIGTGGDTIDFTGTTGNAIINAFSGSDPLQFTGFNTLILAGNGVDSIWGGDGDIIGIADDNVAGGTHLWSHGNTATSLLPGPVWFGSFDQDTVGIVTYDVAGKSFAIGPGGTGANVTIGGPAGQDIGQFNPTPLLGDFLFYAGLNNQTNNAIVATATSAPGGSSIIALPDGTQMTLVGVSQQELGLALQAGSLFKVPS